MVPYRFNSEVGGVEEPPVDAFASESPIRINLTGELDAFALLRNSTEFTKLAS
jgi:hypothetical protein